MPDITDAAARLRHMNDALEVYDRLRELFRLTDEEREAIDQAYCSIGRDDSLNEKYAETLRDILLGIVQRLNGAL